LLVWRPRSHARPRAGLSACGLLIAALGAPRRPHAAGVVGLAAALSRAAAGRPFGVRSANRGARRAAASARGVAGLAAALSRAAAGRPFGVRSA